MALKSWTAGMLVGLLALSAGADPGDVFYVNKNNTSGVENGLTWATAMTTIQSGIETARRNFGGEVWVVAGVYDEVRPTDGSVRLRAQVNVYGGFNGTESTLNQRDFVANLTVIEGATAQNGQPAEHVVTGADNARLDGFTIRGGRGENGAGMFNIETAPIVANCTFTGNIASAFGGGVMNVDGATAQFINCRFEDNASGESGGAVANTSASPVFTNCFFQANAAELAGGAIFNTPGSNPVISGCEFRENTAENGGAIFTDRANPYIEKSLFFDNEAERFGGAIFNNELADAIITNSVFARNIARNDRGGAIANQESGLFLLNCTVAENVAGNEGGGIFSNGRQLLILNSIIWENEPRQFSMISADLEVNYSNVDGRIAGEGNINFNPRFQDPENDNYNLQPQSRSINAGTSETAPEEDIEDTARPQGQGIDMGAYEARNIGTPEPLPVGCPAGTITPGGGPGAPSPGQSLTFVALLLSLLAFGKRHVQRTLPRA